MTTLEEITATENWVKSSSNLDDGEKYRWLKSLSEMRVKEEEAVAIIPATREEIDAVFGTLDPTYRPAPKPDSEKTAGEKEIDKLLNSITPWM